MSETRAKGAVDQTFYVALCDANGAPVTTLTNASAGLTITRWQEKVATATVSPVAQTATGAHSDGGFVHIAGGVYRVDAPDSLCADNNIDRAYLQIAATGIITRTVRIDLTDGDPYAVGYTLQQISDAVMDLSSIDGQTLEAVMRGVAAALFGKNAGTAAAPVLRDITDAKNRISSNADRTTITVDLTP